MIRNGLLLCGFIGASVLVSEAAGQCPAEMQKLLASPGAASELFGIAVAMDGQTAVIGARNDATNGFNAGAAYIFVRSGGAWTQTAKLLPSDGQAGNAFGSAVSISGDRVVIGAIEDNDLGAASGSAYVFTKSGVVWSQTQKLTASDGGAGDRFGCSVAVSNDHIVIGAYSDDVVGSDSGSAYVFEFVSGAFTQVAKLVPADSATSNQFGLSVAVQNNRALVGARAGEVAVANSGSVYVYDRISGTWTQADEFSSTDAVALDEFGFTVALDGDTAVIGARFGDGPVVNSGSAYVFQKTGSIWTQETELLAPDLAALDQFGGAVALIGSSALVGAPRHDAAGTDAGAVYHFVKPGLTWISAAKLTASDAGLGNLFGAAVGLSISNALIGAYQDDDQGALSGSTYAFNIAGLAPCDTNCDGSINPFDINNFLSLLGGSISSCSQCAGDADNNGTVNPFDINAFLACLN